MEFEKDKQRLEKEFDEEWQLEKKEFLKNENEKSDSYQQIIKEIQASKLRMRDLETKAKQLEKEYQKKMQCNDDLELEKRGKERELKNESKTKKGSNDYEMQLESDLREK